MPEYITINGRRIGPGEPTYIIAEMSANHNQDFDVAVQIVKAAATAGADAVKFQTYTADTLTIDADTDYFQIEGTALWDGQSLHALYAEASMPWEWHEALKAKALDLGLDWFSTPYDASAVDFLEKLDMPVYKVASFENGDLPLLRRIAQTGKPVIMSTGMADLAQIDESVRTLRAAGCEQLALLKCTSAYPAPPDAMHLRTIPHLAETFGVVSGLSDHTLGIAAPVASVALGACIIEKHFTLSRDIPSADSAFSLEPAEFKAMVEAVRTAEQALGRVHYGVTEGEQSSAKFRRSLFVVQDMRAGEPFTTENVRAIRPGYGLHTRYLDEIIGRNARVDIKRGTPLSWELVS